MSKVIGIDLGTTNSCVSVYDAGEAKIIVSDNGNRTTPSVVAFTKAGERLVGEQAKRQQAMNPDRTISSIKREMGTSWKKNIDGRNYNPQIISSMILAQLKKDAERYLNEEVKDAVITVPAYFNDIQRQATKDAGRIAGLNVLRIINEPTSAALSYGLNHGEPQKVLVYDLGGGTFDVSIIEIGEGVIEVLATSGDNHLGGDDFDKVVADYIINEFKNSNKIDLRKDIAAMQRVNEAAEQAKKELSTMEKAQIMLPYITVSGGQPVHLDMSITRAKFDALTKELVDRTEKPVRRALQDAGIAPKELAKVLLVGGSTRIPAVQAKVRQLTGQEPSRSVNPDECVAMGAAILGNTLNGTTDLMVKNDILLLDVTPLSLSIETVGGVATRLIERNTTLPAHYSKVFTTAAAFQRKVEINVLQGERPMAKDNKSIGKFVLKGIQKAMAGVPQIEVTFDIDTNGILKVSAKDLNTMKEQSITINEDERMSDAEIEQAINDSMNYATQDKVRLEAIEVRNDCASLINKTQQSLKDDKDLDKQAKKDLKKACAELEKKLNKMKLDKIDEEQLEDIKASKKNLENVRNDHFLF